MAPTPATAYKPPKPPKGLDLDLSDLDGAEALWLRSVEAQERSAAAVEALTVEIRASTSESAKAREEMSKVVAIGLEHRKLADDRRAEDRADRTAEREREEKQAEARVSLLTKAGSALWEVAKNPTAAILVALAGWLAVQHFGVAPTPAAAPAPPAAVAPGD